MTSTIKVDNIQKVSDASNIIKKCSATTTVGSGAGNTVVVCGSTVTIGRCGGTVALASGATQSGFGRSGSVNWQTGSIKTGDFTAANGEGYFIDTSSGTITVTLPSSPSAGDIVAFSDYARNFGSNALTINRNGEPIGGLAQNATLGVTGQASTFVYVDGTKGWINVQNAEDTETGTSPYVVASGGTVSTCGDFKIHTFTGPGAFCVSAAGTPGGSNTIDYLVIAAGGAGGSDNGGGGGAGGLRFSDGTFNNAPAPANPRGCTTSQPITQQSFPITVGAGGGGGITGNPQPYGVRGSNSVYAGTTTITSTGGGGGATDGSGSPEGPGGSGGGAGQTPSPRGLGNTPPVSPEQGTNGGINGPSPLGGGSGGGGFMAEGQQTPGTAGGGTGGAGGGFIPTAWGPSGVTCGSFKYYAGGGGGGGGQPGGGGASPGGAGGGGTGGPGSSPGTSGTTNTGGGGGAGAQAGNGGNGGSGIVVIRYKFQN